MLLAPSLTIRRSKNSLYLHSAFSATPCRPIAAERPLLGTGDGGYEHRCGRIDQGLGCCMSWGGSALGSTFVIVLLCGCITLMVPTSAVLAEGLGRLVAGVMAEGLVMLLMQGPSHDHPHCSMHRAY